MGSDHSKPTAIDLFSGAGGLSHGFTQAGFHVVASVEIDAAVAATQRANHNYRKVYRTQVINADMRRAQSVISTLQSRRIGQVDVVIGGPPCQGFSRSNRQSRNEHNPLNSLFWRFLDVVRHYQPTVVVLENVADLNTFEKGKVVDRMIQGFEASGYRVEKAILNALHFGVPQRRNRIFFLGTRNGVPIDFPTRRITDVAEFVKTWEAISDLPLLENGASVDQVHYRCRQPQNEYQARMRRHTGQWVRNNLVSQNNDLVLTRYKHIPQGGNWQNIPDDLMQNYADKTRCHRWIYRRLPEAEPSVAITNFRKNMLIHPRQDRGLSVREAARLQSFPDRFVFMGGIGSQQQQVANAVPPLLARAVGRTVRRLLGK